MLTNEDFIPQLTQSNKVVFKLPELRSQSVRFAIKGDYWEEVLCNYVLNGYDKNNAFLRVIRKGEVILWRHEDINVSTDDTGHIVTFSSRNRDSSEVFVDNGHDWVSPYGYYELIITMAKQCSKKERKKSYRVIMWILHILFIVAFGWVVYKYCKLKVNSGFIKV